MAIFYLNEQVNEQTEEMSSEELLNGLAEACDSMMAMLGESNATDRHIGKEWNKEGFKDPKTLHKNIYKYCDSKTVKNDALERIHHDVNTDTGDKGANYIKERMGRTVLGAANSELHKRGENMMDYKKAREAMKEHGSVEKIQDEMIDKKKAIKETCLYILSVIDDI